MPFHIKNPETDALARRLAALKAIGLTEAVHLALEQALAVEAARPQLGEVAAAFARDLRAKSRAALDRGEAAHDASHEAPGA